MRSVAVDAVQVVPWATRALAWGLDDQTQTHVTFVLAKDDASQLERELAAGRHPIVEVHDLSVLFTRPAAEHDPTVAGADR